MSTEETRHVALPKLYGGPAYARPAIAVEVSDRPFDPDELPLVEAMTDEERAIMDENRRMTADAPAPPPNELKASPFSLRSLTNRIRGTRGSGSS